jgi:hypothetical protein
MSANAQSKTLAALAPAERFVVEMLAVFSAGEPISVLTRAVGKAGHRVDDRSPKNGDVLPVLQGLIQRGVVDDDGAVADPGLAHLALLGLARDGRLARMAAVARELRPARRDADQPISTWALACRELRLELYAKRWDAARAVMRELPRHIFYEVCSPFEKEWIAEMPADVRSHALAGIVEAATAHLAPAVEALAMLEGEATLTDGEHRIVVEKLVLCGRLDDAELRLRERSSIEADVGRAWLAFLRGRTPEALTAYEAALKVVAKMAGKRATFFPDRAGLFFVVALIADGSPAALARASQLVQAARRVKTLPLQECHAMFSELLDLMAGRKDEDDLLYVTASFDLDRRDPLEILLQTAAVLWLRVKPPAKLVAELKKRVAAAAAAGLHWYAAQGADILDGFAKKPTPVAMAGVRLATVVSPRERWMDALDTLAQVAAPASPRPAPSDDSDHRLVWIVRKYGGRVALEPREQTRSKGTWSKGKPVALKRLFDHPQDLGFLSAADLVACKAIESQTTYESFGRYPRVHYFLDAPRALLALAGSANLLSEVSEGVLQRCEVRRAVPRLEVAKTGALFSLSLVPRPAGEDDGVTVVASGPSSVDVVEFGPIHHAIAEALGRKPLEVPVAGEARLRAVLDAMSGRIAVHAELADDGVASVAGDPRPCFVLRVLGEGLMVSAHVRPLGPSGPLARPGQGGAILLAQVAGHKATAARDLEEERRRFAEALAAAPVLSACQSGPADFTVPDRVARRRRIAGLGGGHGGELSRGHQRRRRRLPPARRRRHPRRQRARALRAH